MTRDRRAGARPPVHAAVRFSAVFAAFWAGHQAGDYWVQREHQAVNKHRHGDRAENTAGRAACAAHVASYTVTATAAVAGVNTALRLGLGWRAVLAGQAVSAITHYVIDRRYPLAALARVVGKDPYYQAGGAANLDQAAHAVCLTAAALTTATLAPT